MEQLISVVAIAVALFASTNVDDVFVLLGFFADSKVRARRIVVGQYLGIGTLYGVSVVASLVSLVIPPAYIGILGAVPIAIGLRKLWDLRQDTDQSKEEQESYTARDGNVLAVAMVTIANGGDNISIYTPLFATRSGFDVAVIGVVFAVMAAIWIGIAHWLTNHRTIGAPIRRYGHRVVPFVLIALGALILFEAETFGLLRFD